MRTRLPLLATLAAATLVAGVAFASAASTAPLAGGAAQARATVTVRSSDFGRILFDSRGRALYAFTHDLRGRSRCSGACATAWPPYILSGTLRAPVGVDRALLGTTRRADGKRQVTFAGRPLYYYVNDRNPGDVFCQNVSEFGGLWLVVRPSGRLVR